MLGFRRPEYFPLLPNDFRVDFAVEPTLKDVSTPVDIPTSYAGVNLYSLNKGASFLYIQGGSPPSSSSG